MKKTLSLREHASRGTQDAVFGENVIKAVEAIEARVGRFSNVESFKQLREFAYKNYAKLGEAMPASAFAQLFRAGVLTDTNGWYERTAVEYEGYTFMESTNKKQEFWAPLWGSQFPTLTPEGQAYSENKLLGQDIEFIPAKYMGGESFTREMFDDDQTGQIRARMKTLGESARLREELEIAGRLVNTALTFGNATVGLTNYTRTNSLGASVGAFSTTFYGTRGGVNYGNRPATFVQLSMSAVRVALQALKQGFDPLGIPIAIRPDSIVVSPADSINARTIFNSTLYPGVQGQIGGTNSTAASSLPFGQMGDNMLKGMLSIHENLFMPSWAWNIGVKNTGLMFLRRDPLEVTMEQPQSGQSFNQDTMRFRSRARWAANWNDASFWYQGNDGSVAGTQ